MPTQRPRRQLRRFVRKEFEKFADKQEHIGQVLMFASVRPFKTRRFGESVAIKCGMVDENDQPTGETFEFAATADSALASQVIETLNEMGEPFVARLAHTRGDNGYWYFHLDQVSEDESGES